MLAVAGLMLELFLMAGVAALANGRGGGERERAMHASKTLIRPLAAMGEAR